MMRVIVVCGPTASGKSALAMKIAESLNGEIVSADSMQIYKEMNIGTAKPMKEDMTKIPHHLIDIRSVTEEYSVSEYVQDAGKCIDDILSRGKVAVVTGGTGLYIDSLISNVDFKPVENTSSIRDELNALAAEKGNEYIFEMLKDVDPKAAESIHINNTKRIIRALEINLTTGKTLAQTHFESKREPKYQALFIGINYRDRQRLYDRINLRVEQMFNEGLLQEAKLINSMELSSTAVGAIGYKELDGYFNGKCTLEESSELLKQKTRNYAKRQLTWFKRNNKINWFYPDDYQSKEEFIGKVLEVIKKSEV